jgi:hypothetical protein
VFFLLMMVFVCGMVLTYPAWRRWHEVIFPPAFVLLALARVISK